MKYHSKAMIHCPKLPTFQMKDSPNLSALASALVKFFQCKPHICPQVSLCIGLEGCLSTRIRRWKPEPLWPQNRLARFLCVPSTSERPRPVLSGFQPCAPQTYRFSLCWPLLGVLQPSDQFSLRSSTAPGSISSPAPSTSRPEREAGVFLPVWTLHPGRVEAPQSLC